MKLKQFCIFGGLVFSVTTLAQADRSQLDACYTISNDNARLACYDALARPAQAEPEVATQTEAPPAAAPVTPPTIAAPPPVTAEAAVPARPEPPVTADEDFGQRQSEVERDAEDAIALVDTIAAIEEVGPDKVQITLANGQVWRQSISKRFLLRESDTVRITQTRWGSAFRLAKDGKPGYIQVLRLR